LRDLGLHGDNLGMGEAVIGRVSEVRHARTDNLFNLACEQERCCPEKLQLLDLAAPPRKIQVDIRDGEVKGLS